MRIKSEDFMPRDTNADEVTCHTEAARSNTSRESGVEWIGTGVRVIGSEVEWSWSGAGVQLECTKWVWEKSGKGMRRSERERIRK